MITPESRRTMEQLDAVDLFALGGIGFAAAANPGETLALALSRRPDAVEAFAWLAQHGAPVARLYAYWALRTLAPDQAHGLAASIEADTTSVQTMTGCIGGHEPVGQIAARMTRRNDVMGRPMPRP